jgi:hypothetical protein
MITDEQGEVRRKLFFDNIRDYQGDTPVNTAIANTIRSERRIEFPLLNNGVTVVTRKLQRVGNEFQLEDFQIVNGCQTSHVIAKTWETDFPDMLVPVKIIATEDEEITRSIIVASNSQNTVDQDSFWALDPIHKQIEIVFESQAGDRKLFYERRPGQYNSVSQIEKVRIVTKEGLLKSFASIFLEEPNQVGRYYKDLIPRIGKDIFNKNHSIAPYYTAAFMAFRLEWLFRNRRLDPKYKPFRFQLGMAARLLLERDHGLDGTKKLSSSYCEDIDDAMADPDVSQGTFDEATAWIDACLTKLGLGLDRRTAKMRDMRDALKGAVSPAPSGGGGA